MSIASLEALQTKMTSLGATRLLFKVLSVNDNSKQQIYLGAGYDALKMIPGGELHATYGSSQKHGTSPRQIIKSSLDFWWICPDGAPARAPYAQLILYPQYPEVRMSGFLRGCPCGPCGLMTSRTAGRILFLGIARDGQIFGWIEPPDSTIACEALHRLSTGSATRPTDLLAEIPLQQEISRTSSRDILCRKLLEIHQAGWIPSFRLGSQGEHIPYRAINSAGYTLEGMFGITPNGIPLPDFLDWELKACVSNRWPRLTESSRLTLLTPEPTVGLYVENIGTFRERYAVPNREGALYFTGTRRAGTIRRNDRLFLETRGMSATGKICEPATAGVFLVDVLSGETAAGWLATNLLDHWKKKHGHTAYVPYRCKKENDAPLYQYSPLVRLAEGVDFSLLLQALVNGNICHDPGVKFSPRQNGTWEIHKRNQFRTTARVLPFLYKSCEDIDLLAARL